MEVTLTVLTLFLFEAIKEITQELERHGVKPTILSIAPTRADLIAMHLVFKTPASPGFRIARHVVVNEFTAISGCLFKLEPFEP